MSFRPFIPRDHGTTAEITSRGYDEVGGPKQAVVILGLSSTSVYDLSHPGEDKPRISFDQARQLSKAGAVAFAEALAAEAGGHFEPGDAIDETVEDIMAEVQVAEGSVGADFIRHLSAATPISSKSDLLRDLDHLTRLVCAARRKLAP